MPTPPPPAPSETGRVYSTAAFFAMLAVATCHGASGFELLADIILLALPLGAAFLAFCTRKPLLHHSAWGALVPFTPLALYFLITAPEIAASDAQGALIYIFGPICIGLVVALGAGIGLVIGLVLQTSRPPAPRENTP